MSFNANKFKKDLEKQLKDGLAKAVKKELEKKGVKNVRQTGSKGILPEFKGDVPEDSPLLKKSLFDNNIKFRKDGI